MRDDVATQLDDDQRPAPPSRPALVVLHSPDDRCAGAVLPLAARLRIGRTGGADLDLAIDDAKLSRAHAAIVQVDGGFRIEDQKSTNGTFVNGLRVRARGLAPGDIIRVGETLFELVRDAPPAAPSAHGEIIGAAPGLRALLDALDRVAPTMIAVLLCGPTGTGKELLARRLHARSGREGPLVAVNCGAIPPNLVEATFFGHRRGAFTNATSDSPGHFGNAEGGTLFLDEIGVMPLAVQPALLRAIEAREHTPVGASAPRRHDVRVVSATNVDLGAEVTAGRFRPDLYARIAEEILVVPPLRERRGDIPLLARHFLERFAPGRELTLGAAVLEALLVHDYPLNVRELRAAMQHIALIARDGEPARVCDLPAAFMRVADPPAPLASEVEAPQRDDLEAVLARHRGNLARVAEHYGKERAQIYRWLRRHGLDADDYRS